MCPWNAYILQTVGVFCPCRSSVRPLACLLVFNIKICWLICKFNFRLCKQQIQLMANGCLNNVVSIFYTLMLLMMILEHIFHGRLLICFLNELRDWLFVAYFAKVIQFTCPTMSYTFLCLTFPNVCTKCILNLHCNLYLCWVFSWIVNFSIPTCYILNN